MNNLSYLVTGGAGFIGSHLVDSLLADERTRKVCVIDNKNPHDYQGLRQLGKDPRLTAYRLDLTKDDAMSLCFEGVDVVYHLAAQPDVRAGITDQETDIRHSILATANVLSAMKQTNVKNIIFSSSGTVYGEGNSPYTEDHPCRPISLYGAGKLGAEALISAYCSMFGFNAFKVRLANVVGARAERGVIHDFIKKLKTDSYNLTIMGDGFQEKPYVHVSEVVEIFRTLEAELIKSREHYNDVINLGPSGAMSVRAIGHLIVAKMKLPSVCFHPGNGPGWIGDVHQFEMESYLSDFGIGVKRSSYEAVELAITEMLE